MAPKNNSPNKALNELAEIRNELISDKPLKRKEGVRNVILAMTNGKDVSKLFVEVLNCSQTSDLELKKMVYLYLLNYSKNNPDMAIMAVNSFVKDTNEPFPLVRALAIRTMACMDVDSITEYFCEPLRKCLKDTDPYVRKTAVLCIGKLHKVNPKLVQDQGFVNMKQYLSDSNPMVVANTVATLAEMQEIALGKPADISSSELNLLMSAMNECGEWGQVTILDYVAAYEPHGEKEAKTICERVTQRLSHSNFGVVMSTIKVILRMMSLITDESFLTTFDKKLCNPLITMISGPPEIQYVALRNISLILQKRPNVLTTQVGCFFVKFNDPIYVKLEKLDIIIRLASSENISRVLPELKEYASGVDIDFVRRSVRAIGYCAIKIPEMAEMCVLTLYELVKTKVDYIIQEAIVVIRDIFRKYPNKYESIIGTFCESVECLDEPEARAALIWIVGEYADRIDNADELLTSFVDNIHDETSQVRLQLLTATVKHYLKKPNIGRSLLEKVLEICTKESDDPDLRDRGFIYWRLISSHPEEAKSIILAPKPIISDAIYSLDPKLLNELIKHIGSVSSVTHKPPSFSFGTEDLKMPQSSNPPVVESSKEADKSLENLMGLDDSLLGDSFMQGFSGKSAVQDVSQKETSLLESLIGDLNINQPAVQNQAFLQDYKDPPQDSLSQQIFSQHYEDTSKHQSTAFQQSSQFFQDFTESPMMSQQPMDHQPSLMSQQPVASQPSLISHQMFSETSMVTKQPLSQQIFSQHYDDTTKHQSQVFQQSSQFFQDFTAPQSEQPMFQQPTSLSQSIFSQSPMTSQQQMGQQPSLLFQQPVASQPSLMSQQSSSNQQNIQEFDFLMKSTTIPQQTANQFNQPQQSLKQDFDFLFDSPPAYNATDPMTLHQVPSLETTSIWTSKVTSGNIQMAVSWNREGNISAYVDIINQGHDKLSLNQLSLNQNSFGLFVPFQPTVNTKSSNHISFYIKIEFQRNYIVNSNPLTYPKLIVNLGHETLQTPVHHAVMFSPNGQLTQFDKSWWSGAQSSSKTTTSMRTVPFNDEMHLIEELRKLNIFMLFRATDEMGRHILHFSMKFDNTALSLARILVSFSERKALLDVICPNANAREIVIQSFNSIFSEFS